MSAVRAIEACDAYQAQRSGVRVGTSRVRWAIESAVAAVFEVGVEELRGKTRGSARTAFARQVAMYLAHVGCGVSLTEVGHLFDRDRTTVAHACSLVEDKRDDPDFDYRLNHLERAVSCLLDALSMRQGRG
jgi:chromosomal replication initiation ATPase DnaA